MSQTTSETMTEKKVKKPDAVYCDVSERFGEITMGFAVVHGGIETLFSTNAFTKTIHEAEVEAIQYAKRFITGIDEIFSDCLRAARRERVTWISRKRNRRADLAARRRINFSRR